MTKARIPVALALLLLLAAIGCDRAESPEEVLGPQAVTLATGAADMDFGLDRQLANLMETHAPGGGGLDYFRLPNPRHLDRIPQDPKNPLTRAKVRLGQRLYHETALGVENDRPEGHETYSCAACHHAQAGFQANLPQGVSEGGSGFGVRGEGRTFLSQYDGQPDDPDCQPIRTPTSMNGAYQELNLWNGQFGGVGANLGTEVNWFPGTPLESNWLGMEALETQAHAGLSGHRMADVGNSRIPDIPWYQAAYRDAFPGEAEPINLLNTALAIAAYERTLLSNHAPYQEWLRGDRRAMTDQEKRGALVFFGKGACVSCHTGPALNDMNFYALGMGDLDHCFDPGRVNLEQFFDAVPWIVRLGRGGFTGQYEDEWAFKTPQLYNLADSPFHGHGATFGSIREVIEYKNTAVTENPYVDGNLISDQFVPLGLTNDEMTDLAAFIETALYDPNLERYVPSHLPSGNCFPVNDPQAQLDLGCGTGEPHLQAVALE